VPRVNVAVPSCPDTDPGLCPGLDLDAVEELVDAHHVTGLEPGLAYGVVQDGRLIHSGGRGSRRHDSAQEGPPGADTVFRIASMTKSFTAAAVLLLRDSGFLRLDDEVAQYVPEVTGLRPPTDDAPALTVRSLLTMTAGFPTDDPWGDRQQDLPEDEFTRLLKRGVSFAWPPGVAFEYSNLGYALAGRVISAAAGEPYADVVRHRLLDPLGMASTGFTTEAARSSRGPADLATGHRRGPRGWEALPFAGYGAFASMGGLFSTVTDLARWVGGLAGAFPPRDGESPGEHPLRRSSRREMQLPHLGLAPAVVWTSVAEPPTVTGVAYGFGLVIERDPRAGTLVWHSGGYPGFGSHMRWHPATGLGVIVLGNATYTPVNRLGSQIMSSLLARWHARGPILPGAPVAGSMESSTATARRHVNELITRWDGALAEELFSSNVDLDEPLARRRAAVESLQESLGPLVPDDAVPVTSLSPAHASWWLRGPGGRVRVEIRLSPERPSKVQALTLVSVPYPPPSQRKAAAKIVSRLGEDIPDWPGDIPLGQVLERAEAVRRLRTAAAWSGAAVVDDVVASTGDDDVTYHVRGTRTDLLLTLTTEPVTRAVEDIVFVPAP
jgi:CubicO group peptidase (beta-lactamase class C family)